MILINVKFTVRPEYAEEWLPRVEGFTRATRAEPGNVFFEWSQSVEDPNQFVLLEAFKDSEAGEKHVNSEHFRAAMAWMPEVISLAGRPTPGTHSPSYRWEVPPAALPKCPSSSFPELSAPLKQGRPHSRTFRRLAIARTRRRALIRPGI